MGRVRVRRKVIRWGHAYGIRLTKAEMERAGLRENDVADILVDAQPQRTDLSALNLLHLGRTASTRHDDILASGFHDDSGR